MATTPLPISPTYSSTLVRDLFDKASIAHNKSNYEEVIDITSEAVNSIREGQLSAILDHRSWAYGKTCQFDDAIKDVERMIAYTPESAVGYLRLGSLLDIQGKSAAAAKVYQGALDQVSKNDPSYEYLVEYYQKSKEKSEQRVDFITMLPPQAYDYIVSLLSLNEKMTWMNVSQAWRKKIVDNKMAWSRIHCTEDHVIVKALPKMAHNIEDLEITSVLSDVWLQYLKHMKNGYFKQIKLLTLDDKMCEPTPVLYSIREAMTCSFWGIQHTLTKLDFTSINHEVPIIYMADILIQCTSLKTLVFSVIGDLQLFLGDFDKLETTHNALIDMDLNSSLITGEAIEPLLKHCPNLRRLLVRDCTPNVFDMIHDHCPNLEILGYEAPSYDVPEIEDELLQQGKQDKNNNNGSSLREIHCSLRGYGVPAEKFMPLLRKNAKTLEVVIANFCITKEQEVNDEPHQGIQPPDYGEKFEFERLEKLIYCSDIYNSVEPVFLHAIRSCPSLKVFFPAGSKDISKVVDTLMARLPAAVEELGLIGLDSEDEDAGKDLVRLLKAYDDSIPTANQKLRSVKLYYSNAITDDVLDVLSGFKALEICELSGLTNVTKNGIKNFLQETAENAHITELELYDMDLVDDAVLRIISKMEHLNSLSLGRLSGITDEGFTYIVDNVTELRKLTVKYCDSVSDNEDIREYVENNSKIEQLDIMLF